MFRACWKTVTGEAGHGVWSANRVVLDAWADAMNDLYGAGSHWVEFKAWQVWSTTAPHAIDLSDPANPPTTPEAAVLAACLWDLDVDDGSWFGGGVATVVVSPDESAIDFFLGRQRMLHGPTTPALALSVDDEYQGHLATRSPT